MILVTRNILSSPSYLDSFFNSLWLLSSDNKGHVLWGIMAKPEADHTPPPNIDVRNTLNVTLTLTQVVIITRTALIFTDVFRSFEKHFTGNETNFYYGCNSVHLFLVSTRTKQTRSFKQHNFPTSIRYSSKFSNAVPFSLNTMGCQLTDILFALKCLCKIHITEFQ